VAAMTKVLIQEVDASGLDVKISVFESGEWKNSTDYVDALLGDPEIAPYLDHLAIHSYWSDGDDKARLIRYLEKNYPGVPVEMTEWTEMEQGRDIRMDSGLLLANTVYEDLTIGRVISWQYVSLNDHEITETKRLWTLGNFSRYIRPGYRMVGAESDLPRLRTTAYQSPDGSELVVVVINNDEQAVTMGLSGIPGEYSQAAAYETSKELNLVEIFSGDRQETFEFAPESVTTLVFRD